ncbi:hypothetical protein DAI22_01g164700 [Oryza sativa Japonica Group]|nr:hypothetical protein DAI22_01g164700 [Oryza sativa Japonica Group]
MVVLHVFVIISCQNHMLEIYLQDFSTNCFPR